MSEKFKNLLFFILGFHTYLFFALLLSLLVMSDMFNQSYQKFSGSFTISLAFFIPLIISIILAIIFWKKRKAYSLGVVTLLISLIAIWFVQKFYH